MPALRTLLLDEHGQALVGMMAFLLVRIAILGISLGSQFQEALAFWFTKVEQYNSHVVSSRAMFATVASEDLWTSQNKDPVCSALSKRSLVAMEVLVRPSNEREWPSG